MAQNINPLSMNAPLPPPPVAVVPGRRSGPPPSADVQLAAAPTLAFKVAAPRKITPKVFIYAPEKFGKTTVGAHAPKPLILQIRDQGYQTLLNAGRAPAVPAATIDSWDDLNAILEVLRVNQQGIQTLVIDGITGAERLCHEWVCKTYFKGDWSDSGFMSYHKGYDMAVPEWTRTLAKLDAINSSGVTIIMIGHARTKEVKNPMGANYDRYEPDVHAKTWGPTAKWADAIIFGKFHTIVEATRREEMKSIAERKGKAIGGIERVLFTSPCDAFVAGNRYGMDEEIWLHSTPVEQMWSVIDSQINRTQPAPVPAAA